MENLAKNRPRRPGYFPKHMLGKMLDINPEHLRDEEHIPRSAEDAIATIKDSGLFADWDWYPAQPEMIEDEARLRWPELFGLSPVEIPPTQEEKPSTVSEFFAAHRRHDGHIDWDSVAKATTYVVSASPNHQEPLAVISSLPQQVGQLASVDVVTKVG